MHPTRKEYTNSKQYTDRCKTSAAQRESREGIATDKHQWRLIYSEM